MSAIDPYDEPTVRAANRTLTELADAPDPLTGPQREAWAEAFAIVYDAAGRRMGLTPTPATTPGLAPTPGRTPPAV